MASECLTAARLKLTTEAIWRAVITARGSDSSSSRVWVHAAMLQMSSKDSSTNVRQNRLRLFSPGATLSVSSSSGSAICRLSIAAIWHKHVADTPHGLNVARHRGVGFNQLAQARHLHIQTAVKGFELSATGQLGQFFA